MRISRSRCIRFEQLETRQMLSAVAAASPCQCRPSTRLVSTATLAHVYPVLTGNPFVGSISSAHFGGLIELSVTFTSETSKGVLAARCRSPP